MDRGPAYGWVMSRGSIAQRAFVRRLPPWVMAVVAMTGCSHYRGDGRLRQVGVHVLNPAYVLTLADIDLSRPGTYEFELAGLPRKQWVLGFTAFRREVGREVVVSVEDRLDCNVRIALRTSDGALVFDVMSSTKTWFWSGQGFVFFDATESVVDKKEQYGSDAIGGSYFKPRWGRVYRVRLEVLSGDARASDFVVRFGGQSIPRDFP